MLTALARTMPDMPPESWWLAAAVLLLLGVASVIDARTARVPDSIIFPGLLITTAAQGFLVDWPFAARQLTIALAAGFLPYLVNLLWYRWRKRDALGMGDAKWTMLAVDCFGPLPALVAWFLGAWLALGWMGTLYCARALRAREGGIRIQHRPVAHIHFAPFLLIGLMGGIYWLRWR